MMGRCVEPGCRARAIEGGDRCRQHGRAFYVAALPEEMRAIYQAATEVQGLDDEIALLRVLVRKAAEEHPDDADFRKKYELLVRAVSTHYRVSKRAGTDLMESVVQVLEGISDIIAEERE